MTIQQDTQVVVTSFIAADPTRRNRVYLTGGNRTWQEQLHFILERNNAYLNIKQRFRRHFRIPAIPPISRMTATMMQWWHTNIMAQAGRTPGFPHVGGMAQDISVRLLNLAEKQALETALVLDGISILMERVTGANSQYGVAINLANVFHCTN